MGKQNENDRGNIHTCLPGRMYQKSMHKLFKKRRNICNNTWICRFRKITSADSGENDIYLLTELQALLDKALSKLPETYRLVFEMNRLEGKSFDEIAETLNISVRTAKRYKSQATDILKEDLKDYLSLVLFLSPSLFN